MFESNKSLRQTYFFLSVLHDVFLDPGLGLASSNDGVLPACLHEENATVNVIMDQINVFVFYERAHLVTIYKLEFLEWRHSLE